MADEQDSPKRARPAPPAIPPFRGTPGVPPRPSMAPSGTGALRRAPAPFVGTRTAAGQAAPAPNDAAVAELPSVEAIAPAAPHARAPEAATPDGVDIPSTPNDLPWLDTSASDVPPPSEALPFPPYAQSSKEAVLEETKHALEGLPYFDVDGDVHEKGDPVRASGTMHRVEFDIAGILDRIASRVRSGDLVVPDVDPLAGEGAALAAVLAALLRHRG